MVYSFSFLGRAEAYASKNKPIPSLFDGIGMGLGFTLSITCIGAVRELIGAGSIFGKQILPLADAAADKNARTKNAPGARIKGVREDERIITDHCKLCAGK